MDIELSKKAFFLTLFMWYRRSCAHISRSHLKRGAMSSVYCYVSMQLWWSPLLKATECSYGCCPLFRCTCVQGHSKQMFYIGRGDSAGRWWYTQSNTILFHQMTSAYLSKSAPSWQFLGTEFTYQNPPCPLTQRGVIIFQIGDLSLGPMTLSKLDELEGSSPRSCSLPAMYLRKVYSI